MSTSLILPEKKSQLILLKYRIKSKRQRVTPIEKCSCFILTIS